MTRHQQFIEAACEAVRRVSRNLDGAPFAWLIDAEDALCSLPEPPAMGEEELVVEVAKAIYDTHSGPWSGDDFASAGEGRQDNAREEARAALSVIRDHDRREAEEAKEVLRDICKYAEDYGVLSDDLRARAERMVKR